MTPFRIGTRGSALAWWQANHVAELLRPLLAPRAIELVEIRTTGDQAADQPLAVIGGQGVFTREIQQAVLDGRADLAVHSLKDLPTEAAPGLALAAVPLRASPHDAFLSVRHASVDALPPGAKVATGSARRQAQLLRRRRDVQCVAIRGNVDTRLRKLQEGNFDALILAQAGLERLGLNAQITEVLDWMLPAVGQGALGLECRANDQATLALAGHLNHAPSRQAVLAERAFLHGLGGGCLLPLAALGKFTAGTLELRGAVFSSDGKQQVYGERHGIALEAEGIGQGLAEELLGRGARELLARG
jgi:hydroxymethylbilane synthase